MRKRISAIKFKSNFINVNTEINSTTKIMTPFGEEKQISAMSKLKYAKKYATFKINF